MDSALCQGIGSEAGSECSEHPLVLTVHIGRWDWSGTPNPKGPNSTWTCKGPQSIGPDNLLYSTEADFHKQGISPRGSK